MEPTIYKPSIYKGAGIYKAVGEGGGGGGGIVKDPIYINIESSVYSNPCYIDNVGFFVRGTNTQAGISPKLQITDFTDVEINLHVYIPPSPSGITGLITKAPNASYFIQMYYSNSAIGLRINNSFINEFPKVIVDKESRIKITYNKTTKNYAIYIDDELLTNGTTIDFSGRDICVAFGFKDGSFSYHPKTGTIYYKDGTNIIVNGDLVFEF